MKTPDGREKYGRWALVAGGSEGIGAAFARALAARGHDLILVAERPEPLHAVSTALEHEYGVQVRPIVGDLADTQTLEQLCLLAAELEIGVLVCNAAVVPFGEFVSIAREEKLKTLDVNCRATLWLLDALVPTMVARGRGAVVLMSSMAGRQGSALFATYAASKAFALVLAESLWDELRGRGVDVLGVCAGATRTPGWERAGGIAMRFAPPVMEPEDVVREALSALGKRPSFIAGVWNRWAAFALERLFPRRFAIETLGRSTRTVFRNRL